MSGLPTSALALKMARRRAEDGKVKIAALVKALEECLPCMGWENYSDEDLMIEAKKGNGRAPIILRARAALSHAGPVARDGER